MSSVKTNKSKCVVLERWIVEVRDLSFEDLGFLIRILSFPGQFLPKEEFCEKYQISLPLLLQKISHLETKGFKVVTS